MCLAQVSNRSLSAPGLAHETEDHRETKTGPLAKRFGGEERIHRPGQHLRVHTAPSVAHTDSHVLPGAQVQGAAWCSSSATLWQVMLTVPLATMASRALMHRLSSALSSCGGSMRTVQRSSSLWQYTSICGPTLRAIRSRMPSTSAVTAVGSGSKVCCRENASRRCTSEAARCAASWALPSSGGTAS